MIHSQTNIVGHKAMAVRGGLALPEDVIDKATRLVSVKGWQRAH